MTAWPTADTMSLDGIRDAYGNDYDVWRDFGIYYARYALDGEPLEARTPGGLDSAIRADMSRRGVQ